MSHAGLQLLGGLPSCRYKLWSLRCGCRIQQLLSNRSRNVFASFSPFPLIYRLLAGQRKSRSRSSSCLPRARQFVITAARRGGFESDWENEFAPGHRLAKRSQSDFEQLQSSASSNSLDSGSFDVFGSFDGSEDDFVVNSSQAPANQSILHRLFGRHWEDLPAKYKLVFATSMAFVLCNMVQSLPPPYHLSFQLYQKRCSCCAFVH